MPGQKFNLTWQTFSSHAREMFRELLVSNQFADVTLVSNDLKKIRAHRIVLSACSSVLREILQGHQESNPVIFLRGVQHQDLESLLQFIYTAEASVSEDRIVEFLRVAKDLDIKDIAENVDLDHESSNDDGQEKDAAQEKLNERRIKKPQRKIPTPNSTTVKAGQCDKSEAVSPSSVSLHQQGRSGHQQQAQFTCDPRDYKTPLQNNLKRHIETVHDEFKYPCDQCEYRASLKTDLKRHIKFQHHTL